MLKTFFSGLFTGAFVALCLFFVGCLGIFMFGVTHPPQHIHLGLLSQGILDFTSTSATKFVLAINPQGMLGLIVVIMLVVAIIFWISKGLSRSTSTQ